MVLLRGRRRRQALADELARATLFIPGRALPRWQRVVVWLLGQCLTGVVAILVWEYLTGR